VVGVGAMSSAEAVLGRVCWTTIVGIVGTVGGVVVAGVGGVGGRVVVLGGVAGRVVVGCTITGGIVGDVVVVVGVANPDAVVVIAEAATIGATTIVAIKMLRRLTITLSLFALVAASTWCPR